MVLGLWFGGDLWQALCVLPVRVLKLYQKCFLIGYLFFSSVFLSLLLLRSYLPFIFFFSWGPLSKLSRFKAFLFCSTWYFSHD